MSRIFREIKSVKSSDGTSSWCVGSYQVPGQRLRAAMWFESDSGRKQEIIGWRYVDAHVSLNTAVSQLLGNLREIMRMLEPDPPKPEAEGSTSTFVERLVDV